MQLDPAVQGSRLIAPRMKGGMGTCVSIFAPCSREPRPRLSGIAVGSPITTFTAWGTPKKWPRSSGGSEYSCRSLRSGGGSGVVRVRGSPTARCAVCFRFASHIYTVHIYSLLVLAPILPSRTAVAVRDTHSSLFGNPPWAFLFPASRLGQTLRSVAQEADALLCFQISQVCGDHPLSSLSATGRL